MRMQGGRLLGRLFCCVILVLAVRVWAAGPQTTLVQDVVYRADGSTAAGELVIAWQAFVAADGSAVAAGSKAVAVAPGGNFSVALVPNAGSTPAHSYYSVTYKLDGQTTSKETWVIPSTSPATIAQVRATLVSSEMAMQALTTDWANANMVTLGGSQLITGAKSFSVPPSTPDPLNKTDVANKEYVDANAGGAVPADVAKVDAPNTWTQSQKFSTTNAAVRHCDAWPGVTGSGTQTSPWIGYESCVTTAPAYTEAHFASGYYQPTTNASGAQATATVSGGVITGYVVTSQGSGYYSLPRVLVTCTGCTGTVDAIATIDANGHVTAVNSVSIGTNVVNGYSGATSATVQILPVDMAPNADYVQVVGDGPGANLVVAGGIPGTAMFDALIYNGAQRHFGIRSFSIQGSATPNSGATAIVNHAVVLDNLAPSQIEAMVNVVSNSSLKSVYHIQRNQIVHFRHNDATFSANDSGWTWWGDNDSKCLDCKAYGNHLHGHYVTAYPPKGPTRAYGGGMWLDYGDVEANNGGCAKVQGVLSKGTVSHLHCENDIWPIPVHGIDLEAASNIEVYGNYLAGCDNTNTAYAVNVGPGSSSSSVHDNMYEQGCGLANSTWGVTHKDAGVAAYAIKANYLVNSNGNVLDVGNLGNSDEKIAPVWPNDGATGTLQYAPAVISAQKVVAAPAATTSGIVGTLMSGAGVNGNASVCYVGTCFCTFDNSVHIGDYVVMSATASACHSNGTARPAQGQILGRALATFAAGAPTPVQWLPDTPGIPPGGQNLVEYAPFVNANSGLSGTQTWMNFKPSMAIIVDHITLGTNNTTPHTCSVYPVLRVTDGSNNCDLTWNDGGKSRGRHARGKLLVFSRGIPQLPDNRRYRMHHAGSTGEIGDDRGVVLSGVEGD